MVTLERCRYCGRETSAPCMNTRDMEEGNMLCLDTLKQKGGGERGVPWVDRRIATEKTRLSA